MLPETGIVPKKGIGQAAAELEQICQEIDSMEGEITDAIIARFDDARMALGVKTDAWILYLDALKAMTIQLKERRDRAAKALKSTENLHKRLRDYVRYVMESNPDLQFKGEDGTLYLAKNPEGVRYAFDFKDVTFYRTCDEALISMEPGLNPYVKEVKVYLVDHERVKGDLQAGMHLGFAELTHDKHVRIKG